MVNIPQWGYNFIVITNVFMSMFYNRQVGSKQIVKNIQLLAPKNTKKFWEQNVYRLTFFFAPFLLNLDHSYTNYSPGETGWLSCKILPESCKKRLSCKILAEKWLSCKICQKNGYLARFARKGV